MAGAAAIVVVDESATCRPVADLLMRIDGRTVDESCGRQRTLGEVGEDESGKLDRRVVDGRVVGDPIDVLRTEGSIESEVVAAGATGQNVAAQAAGENVAPVQPEEPVVAG